MSSTSYPMQDMKILSKAHGCSAVDHPNQPKYFDD